MSTKKITNEHNSAIIYTIEDDTHIISVDRLNGDNIEYISKRIPFCTVFIDGELSKNCILCKLRTNAFVCKDCRKTKEGKSINQFYLFLKHYIKTGYRSVGAEPHIKERKRLKSIEKYGVDNPSKANEIKNIISKKSKESYDEREIKRRQTIMIEHGVDHYSKTKEFKEKYKNTSLEKYGVEHLLSSDIVRKKYTETMIENHGVCNPSQSSEIRKKTIETNINKYGHPNPSQSSRIKTKIVNTNIAKYGVQSSFQRKDVIDAMIIKRQINKYGRLLKDFEDEWREEYFNNGLISALSKYPAIKVKTAMDTFLRPDERVNFCGRSKIDTDVRRFFENNTGLKFEHSQRGLIKENKKLEIDMINREHKISIEFNGIYWHQIKCDTIEKDIYKAIKMRSQGWKHISIDETDLDNLEILNSIINPQKRVLYARKCDFRKIDKYQEREFLNKNHISGHTNSTICYGLYHENILVMLMSFGKDRFSSNQDFELIRLCSIINHSIIGGAERLFKAFTTEHPSCSIVSYSNNKYFDGGVYKRLGFEFVSATPPNYVWMKGTTILKRYSTMKHKLLNLLGEDNFNSSLTESENMQANGYSQIKDLGNMKWVYK